MRFWGNLDSQDAATCYNEAIALHGPTVPLIESLLLNVSACHLKASKPGLALDAAAAALAVSAGASAKAYLRCGAAMDLLDKATPASRRWTMRRSAKISKSGPDGERALLATLERGYAQGSSAASDEAVGRDVMARCILQQAPALGAAAAVPSLDASGAAVDDVPAAEALKEKGNICFRANDFTGALALYESGLDWLLATRRGIALLLCNRAACGLKRADREHLLDCILDARAALSLDPASPLPEAHFRIASALI